MKDILDFIERHWEAFTSFVLMVCFLGWPFSPFKKPVKVSRGQPGEPDYLSVEASNSNDAEELLARLIPQPPTAPTVIEIGAPGTDSYIRISAADSDEAQTLLEQVNETILNRGILR